MNGAIALAAALFTNIPLSFLLSGFSAMAGRLVVGRVTSIRPEIKSSKGERIPNNKVRNLTHIAAMAIILRIKLATVYLTTRSQSLYIGRPKLRIETSQELAREPGSSRLKTIGGTISTHESPTQPTYNTRATFCYLHAFAAQAE